MRILPGIHLPHYKNSADRPTITMPPPDTVAISLSMHIGSPAKPVVKMGDIVKVGQMIGRAEGAVSAHVFASVSGTVKDTASGAITIESDGEMALCDDIAPYPVTDRQSLLAAVRASGAVGLGGAGFPTEAKLTVNRPIDYIIINGAECEPYITSDTRAFIEDTELIKLGMHYLIEYLVPIKCVIAIEDNKPEAIALMRETFADNSYMEIAAMKTMYPQGGEKMLIHNITGQDVPEGKLPIDVGAIVLNVSTLVCIARFIKTGMPLVSRRITVDGSAVQSPVNITVPIGTTIKDVLRFLNIPPDIAGKVLLGGPMMGTAVPDLSVPVVKTTNAITVIADNGASIPKETPCIRCGRCVDYCPMGLLPCEIQNAYLARKPALLRKMHAGLCVECGCCSYVCPAKRPLTQYMKLAKSMLREYERKESLS